MFIKRTQQLIHANRGMTEDGITTEMNVSHGSVHGITSLSICSFEKRALVVYLTAEHREKRSFQSVLQFLHRYDRGGDLTFEQNYCVQRIVFRRQGKWCRLLFSRCSAVLEFMPSRAAHCEILNRLLKTAAQGNCQRCASPWHTTPHSAHTRGITRKKFEWEEWELCIVPDLGWFPRVRYNERSSCQTEIRKL